MFREPEGMIFQQEEDIGEETGDDQSLSVVKRWYMKQGIGGIERGPEETPFREAIIANNADG